MAIDERIMQQDLDLARTAESHGDVPVAAIVVKDGEIIGQSEPRTMADSDPTAHAELLAIRGAAKTLGTPYLAGCAMYGTFEPCPMCYGAIMNSGIDTLVLGGRFEGKHRTYGEYSVSGLLVMAGTGRRGDEGSLRGTFHSRKTQRLAGPDAGRQPQVGQSIVLASVSQSCS